MAQTITEKIAEKYGVTPSTTIAGTLKKITNDETGDVNIASLVSKMPAGSGDGGKVLVLDRDIDFSNKGGGNLYYSSSGLDRPFPFWIDSNNLPTITLEIDGTTYVTEQSAISSGASPLLTVGITNPGDTGKTVKAGIAITAYTVHDNSMITSQATYITINTDTIPSGVHRVKVYMEA